MPLGVVHICREIAKGAKHGLFHNVPMRYGFKVSKRGKNKTKRTWKPNIQRVLLYSEALDKRLKLTVTTTALRAIDYHGGLDNYLIHVPERFRQSDEAKDLRRQIVAAKKAKELKVSPQETTTSISEKKSVAERFYIEKVLKPDGRVTLEMVSNLTGQRLNKKTKEEIIPDPNGQKQTFKTIPQPKPVNIEELRKEYGIE